MFRSRWAFAVSALLILAPTAEPQEKKERAEVTDWSVSLMEGTVQSVDKDGLTVVPRDRGGKTQRAVTMSLIDTSRILLVSPRKEGEKLLLTQREASVKDLKAGQGIAVIYTTAGSGEKPVLLSAVAQPLADK